jgi:hypothetical protein
MGKKRVRMITEVIMDIEGSPEYAAVLFGNWIRDYLPGKELVSGIMEDNTKLEIISAKRIGVDEVKVSPAVIEALTKLTEGLEELKYAEGVE